MAANLIAKYPKPVRGDPDEQVGRAVPSALYPGYYVRDNQLFDSNPGDRMPDTLGYNDWQGNDNSSWSWFGKDGVLNTGLYGLGVLGGIGSGILNYLTGQQSLALARDQINFQKALANRNIANQAKIINNQYDASAGVAAAMASTGNGLADSQLRSRLMSQAKDRHVNGGYIG